MAKIQYTNYRGAEVASVGLNTQKAGGYPWLGYKSVHCAEALRMAMNPYEHYSAADLDNTRRLFQHD